MPEYVHPQIEAVADSPNKESALEVVLVPAEGHAESVRTALSEYAIGDIDETASGMFVTYVAEPHMDAVRQIDGLVSISPNTSQEAMGQGN